MAKQSSVNNTGVTGAEGIYILKETLKLAGWTVPRSSDGTTYNASGDQITSGGSGANGMANSRAWFVVQSPNGEHQWCFQRGTSNNTSWRVKVSALDGFTGGAPSATQVPSATDERLLHGSGTDASPTTATLFPTDSTYRFHVIAESTAVGTAVPIYPFWSFINPTGSQWCPTFISQEAMDPNTFPELSSGTRAAPVTGDPDPCIYVCDYYGATTFDAYALWVSNLSSGWSNATSRWSYWHRMNYGDEAFVANIAAIIDANGLGVFAPHAPAYGTPSNPYNGADEGFPIFTGRPPNLSPVGFKGVCNHLKLGSNNRLYPDTVNLSSGAYVYCGDLLVPWEDGTAPLQ